MTNLVRRLCDTGMAYQQAVQFDELEASIETQIMEAAMDRDTEGGIVPTHKAHTYTYDTSGNLETDTVSDGANTWVRTYSYDDGVQVADSGWVKQ